MSKAVLYYSLSGKTQKMAEKIANEAAAELIEIREKTKRNGFTAFVPGCFQAMAQACPAIIPPAKDLSAFDELVLLAPIWAGHPAPALNSIIALLPEGKTVSLICTSGQGGYNLDKTANLITAKGCTIKETQCL